MNEQALPWDDLRTVMAIARSGSLSGASRRLGVSHATVFRRLGSIEHRLGVSLFERSRSGYTSTPAGEDIAATAERIEAEVVGVERRVAGRDLRPAGTVRVTTTDALLCGLLTPIVMAFHQAHPEITLELIVSNNAFNLSKRETDVALRPTLSPPELLIGRKIGTLAHAIYRPARTTGAVSEGNTDPDWIGWDETLLHPALERWIRAHDVEGRCRYRANTVLGLLEAVRLGLGETVLPCYLADGDDRVERSGDPVPELAVDLWLLTHPDLRGVARIRAFTDFVVSAIAGKSDKLAGEA